jgi:hypothetical protein
MITPERPVKYASHCQSVAQLVPLDVLRPDGRVGRRRTRQTPIRSLITVTAGGGGVRRALDLLRTSRMVLSIQWEREFVGKARGVLLWDSGLPPAMRSCYWRG